MLLLSDKLVILVLYSFCFYSVLHLQPQNLVHMLKKVTWIAVMSSVFFAADCLLDWTMVWIDRN